MFLNRIYRTTARLGLDINTSYLRWVEICSASHQQAILVKDYGTIALAKECKNIAEALRLFASKRSLYQMVIGIALPDSSVQKTTLTLDANLSSIQLEQIFKQTAVKLCNQPLKNLYYRYQVTGFAKKYSSQLNFLLIAVQKQLIKNLLAWLKTYHITPKLIDIESFAVERGQTILANQPITLEKHLNLNEFNQQSLQLALSLGLAVHPALKSIFL